MDKKRILIFLKLKAKEVGAVLLAVGIMVLILLPVMFCFAAVNSHLLEGQPVLSSRVWILWVAYPVVIAICLIGIGCLVVVVQKWLKDNWEKAGELARKGG